MAERLFETLVRINIDTRTQLRYISRGHFSHRLLVVGYIFRGRTFELLVGGLGPSELLPPHKSSVSTDMRRTYRRDCYYSASVNALKPVENESTVMAVLCLDHWP